jgi:hypothetical protein
MRPRLAPASLVAFEVWECAPAVDDSPLHAQATSHLPNPPTEYGVRRICLFAPGPVECERQDALRVRGAGNLTVNRYTRLPWRSVFIMSAESGPAGVGLGVALRPCRRFGGA